MKRFSIKNDIYPLYRLVIPLAFTGLVQSAAWFFETLFLAHLNAETLAAGALVSWLFGTLAVILFGTLGAINILVAHKHGANDKKGIALVARDGLLLALILVIPTFILFWNMSPIFLLFGQSKAVAALAQPYLRAVAWGLPASFVYMALLEIIIGIGQARIILFFSILVTALNIISSYLFIFGKFGFPALGIAGAGWGMTTSGWITAVILIIYIASRAMYREYFCEVFKLHRPKYLFELIQVGAPIGLMYCVEVAFFFALTLLMGMFGSRVQAANQVILQYLGLFMSIMFSIAQAITVRMGHLLGNKEIHNAKRAANIGVITAAGLAGVISILIWCAPRAFISVDFDLNDPSNHAIVNDIIKLLMISAIFQIFESARIAYFGALRGLKDTKFTLLTSIISFWIIAIPIGYVFAIYFKYGAIGFWYGMLISVICSVAMLWKRFQIVISRSKLS